ncbi:Acetyl-CoA synthetase (ADP-forming) [Sphingobium herbicidovorans NBRC 16415]|uniref:Acetyl-CoA synthetase (ADP-forming) n=1 Tax=Sphingobium herbicidovorans (strain ATCC 700291 / DSM 11019 / CCUG 56400 / KCTC 2939 / LMG 18315 / NBRC 16415 / MH) TaxID=1219045 RepID=A0A086PC23_SPHHM|nr:acetate--CoA ligase family protein [Sphingobium herbicidovorans]KFG90941.1 Acetyl-CoA synthetase (ADP-forming) [Sphingobium herbicidovorans NBRC 16415]
MTTSTTSKRDQIHNLFNPRAVAIVGASPDRTKLSSHPLFALENLGFKGPVYAVNPRHETIFGRQCFHAIAELPDEVDTALIVLPAELAVQAVRDCGERGIQGLAILAQGFGEAGGEGLERDAQLTAMAEQYGLAICGPNTNGFSNVPAGLAMTFAPAYATKGIVQPGKVSIVSQSGAMVSTVLSQLSARGVGISKTVTCGNELILSMADYLEYLAEDPETDIILLYVETIRDPAALRAALETCRERGKRVVALTIGESAGGQRAALSHTGAIAGSYRNTVSFLRAQGAIVAEDGETLAALVECALRYNWAPGDAAKTCIVSISGGFAAQAADGMARMGLALAEPSEQAAAELSALPTQSHPVNPYDIAAQNALIPTIIDIFKRDGYDQLIFGLALLRDEARKSVMDMLVEAKQAGFDKIFVATPDLSREDRAYLNSKGIAVATDLRPLLFALRALRDDSAWNAARSARAASEQDAPSIALPSQDGLLDEARSKSWLQELGVRVPASRVLARNLDLEAVAPLTRPVVMKGLSDRIAHKTEHGLVELGLRTDADMQAAWDRIQAALAKADPSSDRILIEEQIGTGLEAIIGVQRDPVIGPVVVVGAGGILVELLDDAVVLIPPFGAAEVQEALSRTRFGRLLEGYRGRKYDAGALVKLAVKLGAVALAEPRLDSLDINPLLVQPDGSGLVAVDAKIFLKS